MSRQMSESEILKVENEDLKQQISRLNRKLHESEQFKSHFLSNIRNAIVNPFSSIIGLSGEIVKSESHDWKRVIKLAALVHSEAFDLDFQLRNIFYSADIESGEKYPDIGNVHIENIVSECLDSFKNIVRKKKLEMKVSKEYGKKYFNTDPAFVSLILSNLIHNAIKFSDPSGVINIKIELDEMLRIEVEDFGKGMSDETRENIFDRFQRGDSQIDSFNNGHGLGLSVSKNLIEVLNGSIDIKSQIGKGSLFIVQIPEAEGQQKVDEDDEVETFLF